MNADELLNQIKEAKRNIRRASVENRDKTIEVEDHGHGYISLNIPADQKHRQRHLERLGRQDQAAHTGS